MTQHSCLVAASRVTIEITSMMLSVECTGSIESWITPMRTSPDVPTLAPSRPSLYISKYPTFLFRKI